VNAELRYHGEYGVEAQLLRQGELVIGRRFDARALAVQRADLGRQALERSEIARSVPVVSNNSIDTPCQAFRSLLR
jgi:hypothetical protein